MTPVLYLVPNHEAILELLRSPHRRRRLPRRPSSPHGSRKICSTPPDRRAGHRTRTVFRWRHAGNAPARRTSRAAAQEEAGTALSISLPGRGGRRDGRRLLPAVCQHYERKNERWKPRWPQKVYKEFPPPPAIEQIAGWNVPGIICAY